MRLLIFVFFLVYNINYSLIYPKGEYVIKGNVSNKNNGEPIPFCNVYLSGTKWGTSSDLKGNYELPPIIPSKYQLVFSSIGFENEIIIVDLKSKSEINIDVKLSPKDYKLNEILVQSEFPHEWEEDLQLFQRYFLGTSKFSRDCIIENKIQINFSHPAPGILRAYANERLKIKNLGLGFLIDCELRKFELNEDERKVQFTILTFFSMLDTADNEVKKEWIQNRLEAYKGSKDHFLYSLKKNDFRNQGFEVSTSRIPFLHGMEVYREEIFTSDSLLSHGDFGGPNKLTFGNYLQVKFKNSGEMRTPVSWLKIIGQDVTLDQYGVPEDIMPFEAYGSWATEGVSTLLPKYYYVLNNSELAE